MNTIRVFVVAIAIALASCAPASTTANDVPQGRKIADYGNGDIFKVCDAGRAVYVSKWGYSGGIDVVENAAECAS